MSENDLWRIDVGYRDPLDPRDDFPPDRPSPAEYMEDDMTDFDSSPNNGEAVDGGQSPDAPRAGEQAPSGPASGYIDVLSMRQDILAEIQATLATLAMWPFDGNTAVPASEYIRNLADTYRLLDE